METKKDTDSEEEGFDDEEELEEEEQPHKKMTKTEANLNEEYADVTTDLDLEEDI